MSSELGYLSKWFDAVSVAQPTNMQSIPATMARLRTRFTVAYRLKARRGYPEELEMIADPARGLAISYASNVVWIRPMDGRHWTCTLQFPMAIWSYPEYRWKPVVAAIQQKLDEHFATAGEGK